MQKVNKTISTNSNALPHSPVKFLFFCGIFFSEGQQLEQHFHYAAFQAHQVGDAGRDGEFPPHSFLGVPVPPI
jgi:hypothetical protein